MKRTITAVFLVAVFAVTGIVFSQEGSYKVIANTANTPDSVSKRDLARIFLKKKKKWPNGQKAQPVEQKGNDALRTSFSKEVLGKSLEMVESHWQAQVFSGKGSPPKQMTSDAAVINFVRSQPGAVGYVSSGASIDGVKVMTIHD